VNFMVRKPRVAGAPKRTLWLRPFSYSTCRCATMVSATRIQPNLSAQWLLLVNALLQKRDCVKQGSRKVTVQRY